MLHVIHTVRKGGSGGWNCPFYHTFKKKMIESLCTPSVYLSCYGEEVLFCAMEVRSEAHQKKKTLATNCVFLSAEGCSGGIEGAAGGGREGGR